MQAINMSQSRLDSSLLTPIKYPASLMNTNPSLAYSASMSFSRSREQEPSRIISPVHQLFKDNVGSQTQTVRGDDLQNNLSSVTLHPVISRQDIQEIIQVHKMVAFYNLQQQQQAQVIEKKQRLIVSLREEIQFSQDRIKKQKQKYKRQRTSLSRSKSKKKLMKRRKSMAQEKAIEDMEIQIQIMKKALNQKKYARRTISERDQFPLPQPKPQKKKKNIIYMQMPMPYLPAYQYHQHNPESHPEPSHSPPMQHYQPQYYHHHQSPPHPPTHRSDVSQVKPYSPPPPSHPSPPPQQIFRSSTWKKELSSPEIQTGKFQTQGASGPQSNPLFQQLFSKMQEKKVQISKDVGLITAQDVAFADELQKEIEVKVNKVTRVGKEKQRNNSPKNLGYFNDESDISYREDEVSHTEKIKNSAKSVDKWVGDQQDLQTVELLQSSTRNDKKQKKIPHLEVKKQKSSAKVKLIESHMCQQKSHSDSNVNISVESRSKESEILDGTSPRNKLLVQSNVNVLLGCSRQEQGSEPIRPASPGMPEKSMRLPIQMSNIMEEDEDAVSTPHIQNISGFPSNDGRKVRQSANSRPSFGDNASLELSESNTMKTAPLDKPPSLNEINQTLKESQMNQQIFDMRLTSKSIHHSRQQSIPDVRFSNRSGFDDQKRFLKQTAKSIPAKSEFQSNYFKGEDQSDQDLGSINLLAESKHSTDNPMSGFLRKGNTTPKPTPKEEMTRSLPFEFEPNEQVPDESKEEYDKIPTPASSKIPSRRGSAIKKTRDEKKKNNDLRTSSNETSALYLSSGLLSMPIEEATQEQEVPSKIVYNKRFSAVK